MNKGERLGMVPMSKRGSDLTERPGRMTDMTDAAWWLTRCGAWRRLRGSKGISAAHALMVRKHFLACYRRAVEHRLAAQRRTSS